MSLPDLSSPLLRPCRVGVPVVGTSESPGGRRVTPDLIVAHPLNSDSTWFGVRSWSPGTNEGEGLNPRRPTAPSTLPSTRVVWSTVPPHAHLYGRERVECLQRPTPADHTRGYKYPSSNKHSRRPGGTVGGTETREGDGGVGQPGRKESSLEESEN